MITSKLSYLSALTLVSSMALFSKTAVSAPLNPNVTVTFTLKALTDVTFLNLNTRQSLTFSPVVTGSSSRGDLKGRAYIQIPEGVYLFNGTEHQPAELGTICRFPDQVVVIKDRLDANDVVRKEDKPFTFITSGPNLVEYPKKCIEDFRRMNEVPDFINPR